MLRRMRSSRSTAPGSVGIHLDGSSISMISSGSAATVDDASLSFVEPNQQQFLLTNDDMEGQEISSTLTDTETVIAQAWIAKRREQLQGSPTTAPALSALTNTAVDVDTLTQWNNSSHNNTLFPQSADFLSTKRVKHRISPYYQDYDAESSISSRSIRTDKTPIVSNRMPRAPPPQRGQGPPVHPPPVSNALPEDYDPALTIAPPSASAKGRDLGCRDVFDISKWHGKVLYALLFLLLVSVITVVGTASLTGSSESESAAGVEQPGGLPANGPFPSPSQTPSVLSPSVAGAMAVTLEASTRSPLSIPPTFSTATPQTSLPFPSRAPTPRPSVLATTASAPTISPSDQLSLSPSLSLVGLARNFQETFRFNHGASAVAISQDAQVIAISDSIVVKICEFNGSWQERHTMPAEDGSRIALNGNGSVFAISMPRETAPGGYLLSGIVRVYLYDFQLGYRLLGQELDIGSSNAFFGTGLALSVTGRTIAVGAPFFSSGAAFRVGQARVYDYSAAQNQWVPMGGPLFGNDAQDWFGTTVAIIEDSQMDQMVVAIGAPHSATKSGFVQTYVYRDDEWTQHGGFFSINNADASNLLPTNVTDGFGNSISLVLTGAGLRMAVGAMQKKGPDGMVNYGMVVVYDYDRQLDQWALVGTPIMEGAGDKLGSAVTLLNSGNLLVVGSEGYRVNRGAVRFYRFNGSSFVSDDGGILQGRQRGDRFGSIVSGTVANGEGFSVVSLAVSANKGTEISLFQQQA